METIAPSARSGGADRGAARRCSAVRSWPRVSRERREVGPACSAGAWGCSTPRNSPEPATWSRCAARGCRAGGRCSQANCGRWFAACDDWLATPTFRPPPATTAAARTPGNARPSSSMCPTSAPSALGKSHRPLRHSIHSVTSGATDGGTVRPSVRNVVTLTKQSNRAGCSTGNSPGLAPFRILST